MCFFCLWVLWLAFIVNKWRLYDILWNIPRGSVRNTSEKGIKIFIIFFNLIEYESFGLSHYLLETAPLEWSEWQRNTFQWWPGLFGEYNISLSGQYVTFVPPIVLKTTVRIEFYNLIFKDSSF